MTVRPQLIRRLASLPLWKIRLLLEAAFWLPVARLALLFVPFPKIGRYLGTLQPPSPSSVGDEANRTAEARKVGWAVNCVADQFPAEMVCLPRALAAWQMLHRRRLPSRLHFGAPLQPELGRSGLQTHAWLSSAGARVTGYPVAHNCVELGYFSRSRPAKDIKENMHAPSR